MSIGMQNLGERSFMGQYVRTNRNEESCEVADLFAANAKCQIHCVFCVDEFAIRIGGSRVKRAG